MAIEPLVNLLACHASYPFSPENPTALTTDGLVRAIALLLGKDHKIFSGSKMGGEVLVRKKTDANRRRLLFRSLAVKTEQATKHTERSGQEPSTTMHDGESELVEDILDVLAVIQPRASAKIAPMPRSRLQETANRLAPTELNVDIRIRRKDMHALLIFCLALQNGTPLSSKGEENDNTQSLETIATSLLQSFGPNESEDISFQDFNLTIEHTMVCSPKPFFHHPNPLT